MNILFTCHYNFDPNAGAAGVTWRLGQEFQKLGHGVQYYSLDDLPKWHPLLRFATFPAFVAHRVWQQTRQQSVDIVDASTADAWIWGNLLAKLGTQRPLLVARCHGLEHIEHEEYLEEARRGNLPLGPKYHLYRGSVRLWESATSMRQADLVLLLNRRDRAYVVEKLGVAPEKAHVMPNGIPDHFLNRPLEPTPMELNDPIRVAIVSSYILRKGVHYAAPALNRLLQRHPQLEVSFLGTEVPAEQVYADFDPAFHPRLRVVPYYPHETLPELLKGHHIKLFPTISEGFGVALVEAMACGLAPVTTDAPGPMEIVHPDRDGLVIPCRDSGAIETAVERLLNDRALLDRLRHQAHATAQRYAWQRIAQATLALYDGAFQRRSALAPAIGLARSTSEAGGD